MSTFFLYIFYLLDGTDYPYWLRKQEIHLCGKIARIIDVYDALTSKRPYSDAARPFKTLEEMKEQMLNRFDKVSFIDFILISKWFLAIIQKLFCPSITATKIWFLEKPKTKSVLVYTLFRTLRSTRKTKEV